MKWWDRMPWILVFWMLSFKSTFSLSSFTFIKRLFSSSLLSTIRVVSSAYLLAPWKKSNDQSRKHIKKQRYYFANKDQSSQRYGFFSGHVWMWELDCEESWALKNLCSWTACWRRLLRVPWAARRSNQSVIKEISPENSLEGLMLKLKLQYFGHLMQRVDLLEKTWCWERLRAGGERDDREWDGWMASPTQCT